MIGFYLNFIRDQLSIYSVSNTVLSKLVIITKDKENYFPEKIPVQKYISVINAFVILTHKLSLR